jgi:hypothetical protein
MASGTAVWYSTGLPAVPIRWVLVRDPQGAMATQALLCTDLGAKAEKIVGWIVMRWQMETTFQEARASGRGGAKAVVGAGNPKDHPGVVRAVLARNPLRSPANDAEHGGRPAGGMVSQNPPNLL